MFFEVEVHKKAFIVELKVKCSARDIGVGNITEAIWHMSDSGSFLFWIGHSAKCDF